MVSLTAAIDRVVARNGYEGRDRAAFVRAVRVLFEKRLRRFSGAAPSAYLRGAVLERECRQPFAIPLYLH